MPAIFNVMGINDRLSAFFKAANLKVSRVEVECGFSNNSLGMALRENRSIGSDRLEIILSTYKVLSAEWLMTGRGSMTATTPEPELIESQKRTIISLEKTVATQDLLIEELKTQLDECRKRTKVQ
ncbi:MAG: hypothetical protein QM762_12365 [Chryseolinea sp.]